MFLFVRYCLFTLIVSGNQPLDEQVLANLRDSVLSVSAQLAAVARSLNATVSRQPVDRQRMEFFEAVHILSKEQEKLWGGEGESIAGRKLVEQEQSPYQIGRKRQSGGGLSWTARLLEISSFAVSVILFFLDGGLLLFLFSEYLPKSGNPEERLLKRLGLGGFGSAFLRAIGASFGLLGGSLLVGVWENLIITVRVLLLVGLALGESLALPVGAGRLMQPKPVKGLNLRVFPGNRNLQPTTSASRGPSPLDGSISRSASRQKEIDALREMLQRTRSKTRDALLAASNVGGPEFSPRSVSSRG